MGSDIIGREFIKKLTPAPGDYDRLVDNDIRAFRFVEPTKSLASKRTEAEKARA